MRYTQVPSVDENLAKVGDSKTFSKLDANSGFWHITLDDESKLLTTLVSPFGRFCFNRLPSGISSAPEVFQRTMSKILEGLEGTLCQMDDVLIHGVDQSEHDGRVRAVLHRLQEAELTLNDECVFSRCSTRFLELWTPRRPTEDHCCDPIPSPFRCRRDTAIHGDGKPSWEIYSPPG